MLLFLKDVVLIFSCFVSTPKTAQNIIMLEKSPLLKNK